MLSAEKRIRFSVPWLFSRSFIFVGGTRSEPELLQLIIARRVRFFFLLTSSARFVEIIR